MLLAEERFAGTFDHAVIVRLARFGHFRVHLAVAGRHAVVRGTLEHCELLSLLRDLRNRLHGRGAGADHAHALAGKIDASVWELAGVIPLAFEFFQTLELRQVGGGQTTDGGDEKARRDRFALVGMHIP